MELFSLPQELKKQGFSLRRGKAKALNEVIVFDDGMLYASYTGNSYYGHKNLLKDIKKYQVKEPFNAERYQVTGIRPDEIVKTHYEWDLDIILVSRFQSITETLNPKIDFYRLDHEDAKPRVSIHALWLAIPEIVEKLEPYLIPAEGTTTLERKGNFIVQKSKHPTLESIIGDDNLSLILEEPANQPPYWRKTW